MRRCIAISLLDFNLTEDAQGHKVYRMRDEYGEDFSDMLELHIIELRKAFSPGDSLAEWVQLFNATTEEDLEMIKTSDAGVKAGIKALREMSLGKQIRMEIEAREKARRDRVAELEYAWDEGMERGRNLINELNVRLLQDGRTDDLKRSTEDPQFQKQLLKEYGLGGK